LIPIKGAIRDTITILSSQGKIIMPLESVFAVTAVIIAFVGFALVLLWAEHQTRDLHRP